MCPVIDLRRDSAETPISLVHSKDDIPTHLILK
jgi:hypothetical protein